MTKDGWRIHIARAALLAVLAANLSAAVPYLLRPADYAGAFELAGVPGEAAVRGFGLLFLMWGVPFIPAILHPARQRVAFLCVLAMQVIGLVGESLMLLGLPASHAALRTTGLRFIAFDGTGLALLLAAYRITRPSPQPNALDANEHGKTRTAQKTVFIREIRVLKTSRIARLFRGNSSTNPR